MSKIEIEIPELGVVVEADLQPIIDDHFQISMGVVFADELGWESSLPPLRQPWLSAVAPTIPRAIDNFRAMFLGGDS